MDRVIVIVNPAARSYSRSAANAALSVLERRFETEVAHTVDRAHATELARAAAAQGFRAVFTMGGDGTLNETIQPLVGTEVIAAPLPGGMTNVMARILGIPRDPRAAAEHLAASLESDRLRRIGVGYLNRRYFLFAAGMGLDAEVVREAERSPLSKRRFGTAMFVKKAFQIGLGKYAHRRPTVTVTIPGHAPECVSFAVCCNARPFTYLGSRAVDACPRAGLDARLDLLALTGIRYLDAVALPYALLLSHGHIGWRRARYFHDVAEVRLTAPEPLPTQVDGDYLGEELEVVLGHEPASLTVPG